MKIGMKQEDIQNGNITSPFSLQDNSTIVKQNNIVCLQAEIRRVTCAAGTTVATITENKPANTINVVGASVTGNDVWKTEYFLIRTDGTIAIRNAISSSSTIYIACSYICD